jgi:ketosteroid isomerase-like protein
MTRDACTLCLVLALATSAFVAGQDKRPPEERNSNRSIDSVALTALACEAGRAYAARDLGALEKLSADDYEQTDVRGGVLNRAQWLEFVHNRKSEMTVECDSVEVRIYGEAAIVTGNWTYKRSGQVDKPGIRSRWTSVWTKSGTDWKRHLFQNTYINPNADHCAVDEAH